jgi:hypothetical protein
MQRQVEHAEGADDARQLADGVLHVALDEDVQRLLDGDDRVRVPHRAASVAGDETATRLVDAVQNEDGGSLGAERMPVPKPADNRPVHAAPRSAALPREFTAMP